ncbi:MAG: hypothetical protein KJI69_03385 [Patescibacteria group bacterium]|nr:hypothetical protein [Patescibacteria group bacterium]
MSIRSKSKSVKSEAEGNSWFGKFKNVFYTSKTIELPPKQKRTYQTTTEDQVLKMFEKKKQYPNLTVNEIAKIVNVTEAVCQYWLEQKESVVLAIWKAKRGRKVADVERVERVRVAEEKREKKRLKKLKKKAKSTKQKQTQQQKPTEQAPHTETDNEKLQQIISKEKYWVEHQSDPNYWQGANPPQSVATEVNFKDQKRRNNINRVNTAKLLQVKEKDESEQKRKDRLRKKHSDTKMKIHFSSCPSCNSKSNLSVNEYNLLVFDEFKRQKAHAMKDQQLINREKQLDKREQKELGTVADRAKDGLELCLKCGTPITYSQSTRTSNIWGAGQFYCADHEPQKPKGR